MIYCELSPGVSTAPQKTAILTLLHDVAVCYFGGIMRQGILLQLSHPLYVVISMVKLCDVFQSIFDTIGCLITGVAAILAILSLIAPFIR